METNNLTHVCKCGSTSFWKSREGVVACIVCGSSEKPGVLQGNKVVHTGVPKKEYVTPELTTEEHLHALRRMWLTEFNHYARNP
jgi:hypothetical protein